MFLGFANFYRKFIKNFSRIIIPLISILQTIGNNDLGAQTNRHKENQDTIAGASGAGSGGVGRNNQNLSTIANLAKSKKSKLTKSKKSDLPKVNSRTDFLTSQAKKAFIHLQKTFTKAPMFRYFDPKCHIRIETDVLGYAIDAVLSQKTSDQHFSGYVTHNDLNSFKSEIGQ